MANESNQHTADAAAPAAQVPEPPFAERARTLVHLGRTGTLSTQSRRVPGLSLRVGRTVRPRRARRADLPHQHHGDAHAEPARRRAREPAGDAAGLDRGPARGRARHPGRRRRGASPATMPRRRVPTTSSATRTRATGSTSTTSPSTAWRSRELYYVAGFGAMGWVDGRRLPRRRARSAGGERAGDPRPHERRPRRCAASLLQGVRRRRRRRGDHDQRRPHGLSRPRAQRRPPAWPAHQLPARRAHARARRAWCWSRWSATRVPASRPSRRERRRAAATIRRRERCRAVACWRWARRARPRSRCARSPAPLARDAGAQDGARRRRQAPGRGVGTSRRCWSRAAR